MARLMRASWLLDGERLVEGSQCRGVAALEKGLGGIEPDPRGLGLIRVSEPTAASMVPRRRLLTRTRSRSASLAVPALPVTASVSASRLPSAVAMTASLSDVRT